MKTITLFFVLSTVWIKCFSQQQALVPTGKKESTPGPAVVSTNRLSGDEIVPASSATLREYEQNPEHRQADQLLAIALGYIGEKNLAQATALYKKVLAVQPNNIRAIRGLGNCYMIAEENDAAISQFKKGWAQGDDLSLLELANVYCFASKRYQDLKPLMAGLLKIQERSADVDVKHEIANILIAYSLFGTPAGDKQLFLSTIKGLSDEFILEREDTAQIVINGLETFKEQERANHFSNKLADLKKSEAFFKAGLSECVSKEYDAAIADFSKAIELNPKNYSTYYGRAGAEFELGKFELAIADDTKAIELNLACLP
jgi:tetratricopeptide (TPR) repeat protein